MKVVLLIVTCVLLGGSHEQPFNTNQSTGAGVVNRTMTTAHKTQLTFIGTVKSVEPLGKRKLSVIPVHFDPRFAVTVQIKSVTPQGGPLKRGTEQVFAIHSPAQLFRADVEDVILKKYCFKVGWEKMGDRTRFSGLTASVIEDKDVPSK